MKRNRFVYILGALSFIFTVAIVFYFSTKAPLHLTDPAKLVLGEPLIDFQFGPGTCQTMTGDRLLIPGDHSNEHGSMRPNLPQWASTGHAYLDGQTRYFDEIVGDTPFLTFEALAPGYLVVSPDAPPFYFFRDGYHYLIENSHNSVPLPKNCLP